MAVLLPLRVEAASSHRGAGLDHGGREVLPGKMGLKEWRRPGRKTLQNMEHRRCLLNRGERLSD